MKRKYDQESPRIGVITDPKKLAWLRAKIERQKAEAKMGHLGKHSSRNGDQAPE